MSRFEGHTPGPWRVVQFGGYPVVRKQFRDDHHMDICNAVHGYMYAEKYLGCTEYENQQANARLIAAAPDLLAENERLREKCKHLTEGLDGAILLLIKGIPESQRKTLLTKWETTKESFDG